MVVTFCKNIKYVKVLERKVYKIKSGLGPKCSCKKSQLSEVFLTKEMLKKDRNCILGYFTILCTETVNKR